MKTYFNIKKINKFLLNILFPLRCLGCDIKDEILCNNCTQNIKSAERETENNILAVFDYRDETIKKAIWELKYHHKKYIGEKLGNLLYEYLSEDISELKMNVPERYIYVIPVPISSKKIKNRGYNQSISIARGFCNQSEPGTFQLKDNIIFKNIDTLPQAKITNRKRRLENVRGVFEIKNKNIVKGRTIIVIDDVTTTGATINEIIKILKQSGAKKVLGFAVAH